MIENIENNKSAGISNSNPKFPNKIDYGLQLAAAKKQITASTSLPDWYLNGVVLSKTFLASAQTFTQ